MRKIVEEKSNIVSDINEHLLEIYDKTMEMKPNLIVELGVSNTFNSTVALSEVAKDLNCEMISIDTSDCKEAKGTINYNKWSFYQMDDTNEQKVKEILNNKLIDVLFIDTSHGYEHTLKEFQIYLPYLHDTFLIILHDTNSSNTASKVQIAIQDYYKTGNLDWTKDFEIEAEGIKIKNVAKNNGVAYIYN